MRMIVEIADVVPSQELVSLAAVIDYGTGVERRANPPTARRVDGKWLLENGHSRYVVARIRGDLFFELEPIG